MWCKAERGTILVPPEARLQFTIESRQLPTSSGGESKPIIIQATNPNDALTEFVRQNKSEVVSMATPANGRESIATVKKDDAVYLVRVYEA